MGYGVATATGVMRVLNNRHWISDVLSGAGIGILSTELGYSLSDLIFKKKGLLRNDISSHKNIIDHPLILLRLHGWRIRFLKNGFQSGEVKYTV
jgi:membrane-associated phospholipid phosphatase